MTDIPVEAREQIEVFNRQEAIKEAQRAALRQNRTSKKEIRAYQESRKPMTARDMESYAMQHGFIIETGSGNHGKHLVAPNNRAISLPDHGGGRSLATGTRRTIIKFIHEHGIFSN